MARSRKRQRVGADAAKPIEQYAHRDKQRPNNPPVGLVTPQTDPDAGTRKFEYDPHLDPQLVWSGKAERTSFEVPTVSLHVHERIDPKSILQAVRKQGDSEQPGQIPLFAQPTENPPLREALDFYQHAHGWSNRLIAGDSLLVMNSLLEKEGMAGKVQMVYIDPPYGIRYGSNFQPFVNRRDVKDGKDEDLTQEPEMIRAFRDTWELGIHSYLTYLRDRLLLARELLHESGSVFVQIGIENLHHVREVVEETFGSVNFCGQVAFRKTTGKGSQTLDSTYDCLLWYSRQRAVLKSRRLFSPRLVEEDTNLRFVELPDGARRAMTEDELAKSTPLADGSRIFRPNPVTSARPPQENDLREFTFEGRRFSPGLRTFSTDREGMSRLACANRLISIGNTLCFVRYLDDFLMKPLIDIWDDTRSSGFGEKRRYVVETNPRVIARCLLMTTDPGDLVFDPTCGSGTTAFVAEQWGRRWITCDTSRVATALAKQRLMTAQYDYYELAHPAEGVGSGFVYKTVPHVTLKSIANNPEIREGISRPEIDAAIAKYAEQETLYDRPRVDKARRRVTGPFTVEAVPAPVVQPLSDVLELRDADTSVARSGETLRQAEWRDELLRAGIRGKHGQVIRFSRVEPLPGTRWLHAEGETRVSGDGVGGGPGDPTRVVVSFGPEHEPLEQKQVERAWHEARSLAPRPGMLVFAAFQFDSEAAKDIDQLAPEKAGMTLLKVQMNADLLTDDLKKKRASNESFWLVGQPDVSLRQIDQGEHAGKWQVEVHGFDYYDTKAGDVVSGGVNQIAMWMLDPDYDDRSIYPRQVFFPMAGEKDGWSRLARSLKAELDDSLVEAYRGAVSLPFTGGPNCKVAVKIVDDRGIESLRILEIEG